MTSHLSDDEGVPLALHRQSERLRAGRARERALVAENERLREGGRQCDEVIRRLADEAESWREIVAHTARVIEAQCFDIPRLGKNRGEILHRVVEELRQAAVGDPQVVYAHKTRFFGRELQNLRDGGR